jgi:glyoxylase-like metal-dependent hydrolase (beta-lactamase superfamily II)
MISSIRGQKTMNGLNQNRLKRIAVACAVACLCAVIPAAIVGQDARTILMNSAKAMGVENLKTIQVSGAGSHSVLIGQNRNPDGPWPVGRLRAYTLEMDFDASRSHVQMTRIENGRDEMLNEYTSPDSPWNSQFRFWLTPFGFIKGALANNATLSSAKIAGVSYSLVTFAVQNKYKVVGYISDQNLVYRVETWIDNDVLGDMLAEAWFNDYKDFGGVKFPTLIVEKQASQTVLTLGVSDLKTNGAVNTVATPATRAPSPVASGLDASVQTEKVADGVYYLKGGTHHSVVVEFSDHAALIEAPLNEQRSLAIIAEVKKLMPNKPIRYVVNTHHHFDHAGGLRTFVDAGATIITHESNSKFFSAALSAPRTLNPDALARSQKKPIIESVTDKKTLSDSLRTLEVQAIRDNPHSDGILIAFLPKEKMLIEADVYTPGTIVDRDTASFIDNVERLKVEFETILPLHGSAKPARAELYAAINKPVRDMKDILAAQVAEPIALTAAAVPVGRQILERSCTSCHTVGRVERKRDEAEWRMIVARMQDHGAVISETEVDTLLDYLIKTFGAQE